MKQKTANGCGAIEFGCLLKVFQISVREEFNVLHVNCEGFTECIRGLLEKLMLCQLIKKLSLFYQLRWLTDVCITARHLFLTWGR
jgi:hypothetical protein